jgi:hypothetical protein
MIVHRKTSPRKKYIHGRGLVNIPSKITVFKDPLPQENAKKAASEIKYGKGFQIL